MHVLGIAVMLVSRLSAEVAEEDLLIATREPAYKACDDHSHRAYPAPLYGRGVGRGKECGGKYFNWSR
jgi:hypothetical protein